MCGEGRHDAAGVRVLFAGRLRTNRAPRVGVRGTGLSLCLRGMPLRAATAAGACIGARARGARRREAESAASPVQRGGGGAPPEPRGAA